MVVIGLVAAVSTVAPSQRAVAASGWTEVGSPFATAALLPFGGPALDSGITGQLWSSAAVGDVTGDGSPEIVVGGGLSSSLQVYSTSRARIALVDVAGVDVAARSGGVQPAPALADLNLDGVQDVVAASTANVIGGYTFTGGTAKRLFWRQEARAVASGPTGYLATPALGHLDVAAVPNMVTASWGQTLNVQSVLGSNVGWPVWLRDTIWSSPAVGDIDGDGANEVVVGGDCAGNNVGTQPCGGNGGGYVWAFGNDGKEKWRWFLGGQTIWSSPALADLNHDGALDVVVGSGGYFPEPAGRFITALNGKNGQKLWQYGTDARVVGSPSLGDATGDGTPDVFTVTYGGYLVALDGANGRQLWKACVTDGGGCGDQGIGTKSGVALADVDGDGYLEAITQGEQHLRIYDAATGVLESNLRSAYVGTILAPANTPTVAQIDGKAWIIQPVLGFRTVNGARVDELVVTAFRSDASLGAAPWPTARANMQRSGAIPAVEPSLSKLRSFVDRVHQDFLSRAAMSEEMNIWGTILHDGGISRYDYARMLSLDDEWVTHVVSKFYEDTLGRTGDSGGVVGWVRAINVYGMPVAQVASGFYGSAEYYAKAGGTDRAWLTDLYVKLLGRQPDAGGLAGWEKALKAGMPRDQVAYGFYQSDESLAVRIDSLYVHFLGRHAESGGVVSWRPFVRAQGDIVLAAALAASQEYLNRV